MSKLYIRIELREEDNEDKGDIEVLSVNLFPEGKGRAMGLYMDLVALGRKFTNYRTY